jgi:hypothetical protein
VLHSETFYLQEGENLISTDDLTYIR